MAAGQLHTNSKALILANVSSLGVVWLHANEILIIHPPFKKVF